MPGALTVPDAGLRSICSRSPRARLHLDCAYCFFLSKEMLYPGSPFRMADDLLDVYLRQLIESHSRAPEVVVAWQGGKPTLMGLDFFRRSVELAESHLSPGQRAPYTIQTNGTKIDEERECTPARSACAGRPRVRAHEEREDAPACHNQGPKRRERLYPLPRPCLARVREAHAPLDPQRSR